MIYGIDISDAQPDHPDLSHADFVMIKATEGHTYVNPSMEAQAEWARAHNKIVGFYHFLWPGNIAAQAAWFADKAASLPGDPLWCDWEPIKNIGLATGGEKDHFIRSMQQLRSPAHKVGLYCDRSRWIDVDTTSFAGDGLWIADPSAKAGHPGIKAPWVLHQYSSLNGLDRDAGVWASPAAMRAWATGHPSSPPPKPGPPPHIYTVKEGDTLSSIAEAHNTTWPVLASINHLRNPNSIYPGQQLKLS